MFHFFRFSTPWRARGRGRTLPLLKLKEMKHRPPPNSITRCDGEHAIDGLFGVGVPDFLACRGLFDAAWRGLPVPDSKWVVAVLG